MEEVLLINSAVKLFVVENESDLGAAASITLLGSRRHSYSIAKSTSKSLISYIFIKSVIFNLATDSGQ